jgi:cytidylate kinase
MYRAVALLALEAGLVPDRIGEAGALAATAALEFIERPDDLTRVFVGEREVTDEIRGRLVSQNVSAVSAEPGVRAVLTRIQQQEAAKGDVVLEGRDIGTVVVPDAEVKVFLTATIEERARRRQLQLRAQGVEQTLDQLIADIAARDAYDSGRELAPLRKADDAVEIDTTGMTIEEVVAAVCALAGEKRPPADSAALPAPATAAVTEEGAAIPACTQVAAAASPKKWPLSRLTRGPLDTWLYRVAYTLIRPLCRLLFRMKSRGVEHFPAAGPVVVACNHRSNLDPFFLGSSSPRQVHFMAKAEVWKFKPLGWLAEKVGTFPVNRGEADRRAVRQALAILEAGGVLGLFPEGRRQRERDLGDIRPGVSLFSLRDGVVSIPAIVQGTDRIVRHRILHFPRVRVSFGPPLAVPDRDLSHSERTRLAGERLVEALRKLLSASPGEP